MNESDIPLPVTEEKPLCVLRENKKNVICVCLLFVAGVLYCVFGIILPVLITGDFSAAHVSYGRIMSKKIAFYLSWFGLFCGLFVIVLFTRRAGTYTFYSDRLEFRALLLWRKISIPYNQMYVYVKTGRAGTLIDKMTTITTENLLNCSSTLHRYKVEFWDGLGFGVPIKDVVLGNSRWVWGDGGPAAIGWGKDFDSTQWDKAWQILKEKAFSFKEEKGIMS